MQCVLKFLYWSGLWKHMNTDIKQDVLSSLTKLELNIYWRTCLYRYERISFWNSINQKTRIILWNQLDALSCSEIWEHLYSLEERKKVWKYLTKEQRIELLLNIDCERNKEFINNMDIDDLLNWWRYIKSNLFFKEKYNRIWFNCLDWDKRIKLWKSLNWEERIFLWDYLTGPTYPKPFSDWTYRFELLEHLEWNEFVGLWKHITWNDCETLCHRPILWKRMNWRERINLWKRLSGDEKYDLFTHLKSDMQNELIEYISEEDKKEIEQRRITS